MNKLIEQFLDRNFEKINKILILTGAGISSESGIPTFRGKGGYWRVES